MNDDKFLQISMSINKYPNTSDTHRYSLRDIYRYYRAFHISEVQSGGFSLFETLIAIGIVLLGLVPSLTLISASTRQAAFVQDQLIAANLAQEGIELARAVRDENWIAGEAFDEGFQDGTKYADYRQAELLDAVPSDYLYTNPANGFYWHETSGAQSRFRRRIVIQKNLPGGEIIVRSRVDWTTRLVPFSLTAEAHLFNWFPL